jgi:hypothetical protein
MRDRLDAARFTGLVFVGRPFMAGGPRAGRVTFKPSLTLPALAS